MPNPITSQTFEPAVDGTAVCTVTCTVQQSGTSSDWGGSDPGSTIKVIKVSDSSVLQSAPFEPCSRTRAAQTFRATFDLSAADGAVEIALIASGGGPGTSIEFWGVALTVEFIKR